MKTEKILLEIEDCLDRCDEKGLAKKVEELVIATNEEESCKELSIRLYNYYTTFKADATAKALEVIIRQRPSLAMLKFPENYLFRVALMRGSMELYQCYMDEAIKPFLKGKKKDKTDFCYMDLYNIADKLTETFFNKTMRCVKGMDFNGAFGRLEENSNVFLINREDYEIMNDVVERYNTILGRRDILKDLNKRMGFV